MRLFLSAKSLTSLVRSAILASPLLSTLVAAASPVHLQTDHLTNPIGIDAPKPHFAWQSDAATPNWMQSAYQLLVATSENNLVAGKADVWDSGRIASDAGVESELPQALPLSDLRNRSVMLARRAWGAMPE
jgi:alpha-L-rhamnosidase